MHFASNPGLENQNKSKQMELRDTELRAYFKLSVLWPKFAKDGNWGWHWNFKQDSKCTPAKSILYRYVRRF